jgi:hypothetical protein
MLWKRSDRRHSMNDLTREVGELLADLTAALRPDWDRAGILAQTHLAARGDIGAFQHCIAMLIAASRPTNQTPSSVNFAASQQRDIDTCGKDGHERAPYRAGYGCSACWSELQSSDAPLPLAPKSRHTAGFHDQIRQTATGRTRR